MGMSLDVDQLYIDPHLVGRFSDAPFKNRDYAKLVRDLSEVSGLALIVLCGISRNDFQISDLGQPRRNLFVYAFGEIGVIWIGAEIFEWQNCDCLCRPDLVRDWFVFPNIPADRY